MRLRALNTGRGFGCGRYCGVPGTGRPPLAMAMPSILSRTMISTLKFIFKKCIYCYNIYSIDCEKNCVTSAGTKFIMPHLKYHTRVFIFKIYQRLERMCHICRGTT